MCCCSCWPGRPGWAWRRRPCTWRTSASATMPSKAATRPPWRSPAATVWGGMLCFAGSNAGEGETIWTTLFPAAVSTALLWVLWVAFASASRVADAVTIDRDTASGLRLAGLLIACGVVLGRAAAGDWHGTEECLKDMVRIGWPAGMLTLAALIAQWRFRPTPAMPPGVC